MNPSSRIYLIDNGSLRPASTFNLRRLAREISTLADREILPVSLLHSSKIDPALLDGIPAMTWERQIKADYAAGYRHFCGLPLFFGPSAAFLEYIPQRLAVLHQTLGPFDWCQAPFIYDPATPDLAQILADQVQDTIAARQSDSPPVILVDHGSPQPAVAAVRDALALQIASILGDAVQCVGPASMERRPGPEYAFNEPLLADRLRMDGYNRGDVVLALLFLSPGRHAGPGGDIATIVATAEAEQPGLHVHPTQLVGSHPDLPRLLAKRLEQVNKI